MKKQEGDEVLRAIRNRIERSHRGEELDTGDLVDVLLGADCGDEPLAAMAREGASFCALVHELLFERGFMGRGERELHDLAWSQARRLRMLATMLSRIEDTMRPVGKVETDARDRHDAE